VQVCLGQDQLAPKGWRKFDAMQQEYLNFVAQLFEGIASDDEKTLDDDESWDVRFKTFIDKTMAEHANRLKALQTHAEQKAETFRARFALFGIVEERLHTRISSFDNGIVDALKSVQSAQDKLVKEVLEMVASATDTGDQLAGGMLAATIKSPQESIPSPQDRLMNAGGAFAAAFRSAADQSKVAPSSVVFENAIDVAVEDETSDQESEEYMPIPSPRMASPKWLAFSPSSPGTSPTSPKSGQGSPRDVFRDLKNCNSYSQRYMRTRPFSPRLLEDTTLASRPGKELVLRQLRQIVTEVYESKLDLDLKCRQAKEPLLSFEAHFYHYLARRYGSKEVVQEWATVIYKAIQKYAPRDNDIAVFGRILQNKLAESFPTTQCNLKQTVCQQLRQQIEDEGPRRQAAEINALWEERMKADITLHDSNGIVSNMYNDTDCSEAMRWLQQHLDHTGCVETGCIRFRDLTQVLLSFQMHLTEAFLADFTRIYHQVDAHSPTGVMTNIQLQELIQRLCDIDMDGSEDSDTIHLSTSRAAALRKVQKMRSANFSECVDLFSNLISARWALASSTAP